MALAEYDSDEVGVTIPKKRSSDPMEGDVQLEAALDHFQRA
jgi:hypothetical protein